jgi:hypothetical protein
MCQDVDRVVDKKRVTEKNGTAAIRQMTISRTPESRTKISRKLENDDIPNNDISNNLTKPNNPNLT